MLTIATVRKWYKNCVQDKRFDREAFEKKLRKHGFRFANSGAYKRVYVHPRYPFVVKTGSIEVTELREHRNYLRPIWGNRRVMVQHKADMRHSKKAYELLESPNWFDAHSSNCGFYKGKPVIIDL